MVLAYTARIEFPAVRQDMGRDIAFQTPLGPISAWRADPQSAPLGALLVIQEIFGVNEHVRSVVERYAAQGYVALAPALFDPVESNVELGYDDSAVQRGRALAGALGFDRAITVVGAAAELCAAKASRRARGRVFCWGAASLPGQYGLGLPAVSYYGARTVPFLGEALRAPMLFQFGERDATIPAAEIALHRSKHADAECFVYPAGHAFNRDVDPHHYDADSARLAHQRTMAFFEQALG